MRNYTPLRGTAIGQPGQHRAPKELPAMERLLELLRGPELLSDRKLFPMLLDDS